jgi:hypothetical protein
VLTRGNTFVVLICIRLHLPSRIHELPHLPLVCQEPFPMLTMGNALVVLICIRLHLLPGIYELPYL